MLRVSRRALVFRRFIARLDTRDPSLIDLPLPVSSVPVVGPLVSPVIGDDADSNTVQPSTSPDTQPTLSPLPGDGNGGGNGRGSIPTPTAGVLPGLPGTPGSLGTADSPLSLGSPGSPGFVVPGSSTLPLPLPSSSPGEKSSLYGTNDTGGGDVVNSPGTSADGSAAIIQVSSGSFATSLSGLSTAYPAAVETGLPSPSQSLQSSGSNSASSSSGSVTTLTVSAGQLSGGAIAGITIVCFFSLLALVILIIRRRSIARRTELRKTWWFARIASGGSFSSAGEANSRGRVGHATSQASRSSSRSSFATNFDQGSRFQVHSPLRISPAGVPDLPPMAEVRDRRQSSNTMLSRGSGPDAHAHLSIPIGHISVRPFSPSESFVFPKPPRPPVQSISDSFYILETQERYSSRCSTPTLVHPSTPPTDLPPTSLSTPSLHPQTLIPAHSLSYLNTSSIPSTNPFPDPVTPEFADTEVIHCDFTPSLDDELAVRPGDRVRLLRVYDDGWVLAEKLSGLKGDRHEQGLIPTNCLYDAEQTSPILSKRVSSCSEHEPKELIGTAL